VKLTIRQPAIVENRSDERNMRTLINELRTQATFTTETRVRNTTPGDGAFKAIWTDTLPEGTYYLNIKVLGRGDTIGAWWEEKAGLQNFGGTLTVIGGTSSTLTRVDDVLLEERLVFTGDSMSLEVKDNGIEAFAWTAFITVLQAG
jgi:hypothetical protein